jgi:glycine oxidase
VFALGCYLAPKYELGIAIGATEEHAGFDETPTLAATAELIELAVSICPALSRAELGRVWASVRPGSADGLPLLGPLPERPGIVLATGHFRNGILLSLITAELVCSWVLERSQPLDVAPFRPDRFAEREVAAGRG